MTAERTVQVARRINDHVRKIEDQDLEGPDVGRSGLIPDAVKRYIIAAEKGDPSGIFHRTELTLSGLPQVIPNGLNEWVGTQLYTWPQGRILVLGVTADLAPTTTTVIADTIAAGATGTFGIGSVVNDGTHTGTKVDLLPDGNFTSSTVINVAAAAVKKALAASAQFDGTTTALAAFLNSKVATNTADGGLAWSGRVNFTWVDLGDY